MAVPSVVLTASVGISGASVVNLTITGTAQVNDIVYVSISAFNGGSLTNSVSCTGSVNAQVRTSHRQDVTLRVAWATITTLTVNPVFTVNFASGMNGVVGAMVIRGAANPAAPFDACPEFPAMRGSIGTGFGVDNFGNRVPFSTFTNDSLLIFSAFANSTSLLSVPSGFTQQISVGSNSTLLVATKDAPTDVSGLMAQCGTGPNQRCIADAIAGQVYVPSFDVPYVVLTASGGGAGIATYTLTFTGTAQAGDIVYAYVSVFNGSTTITTVSCTGSTNAQPRHIGFNTAINAVWATISSTTVDPAITINFAAGCSPAIAGVVVRGAGNSSQPFDGSTSLPASVAGDTVTYTTVDTNDLLLWGGFLNNGNNEVIAPFGWKVYNWDYSGPNAIIGTLVAEIPVTGLSAVETGSLSGLSPFSYADAITGFETGHILNFSGSYSPPAGNHVNIDLDPSGTPPMIPSTNAQVKGQFRLRRVR